MVAADRYLSRVMQDVREAPATAAKPGPDAVLGRRLRRIRRHAGLSLRELGRRVGCSESLLSKVETGHANPSLTMLHRIVAALDISVAALFGDEADDDQVVYRRGQRPRISVDSTRAENIVLERLIPDTGSHLLQANVHIVRPHGGSRGEITHEGEEVGYVLDGTIELTVGGRIYRLTAGDSFVFRSEVPHGYRNLGDTTARILWVNTPTTF